MHRLKWVAFLTLLSLTLVYDPGFSTAQFGKRDGGAAPSGFGGPPGGGFSRGPGGGFKMDPEMVWGMMQRNMAGPTPDTIDLSKMDPRMRDFARKRAESDGSIPLPESGIMTKAQYLDHFARSEAAKAAKAAAGGAPGGTPAAPPSGAPMVVTLGGNTPPPPMGRGPGGFGPPGLSGPGGPGSPSDDRATQRVKEQDKDGDGRVSFAEADSRLKENFPQLDRNGDGYVDLEEYKSYYANRDQNRGGPGGFGGPGGPSGGWGSNNGGGGWGDPNWANRDQKDPKKETQEPKPVAMRYGFLPKDLPDWFDKYDTDKDGQVALHEWRKAGDDIAKFQEMDLNGDGLITADELLRFNLRQAEEAKIAAINGEGGSFNRPSFASAGGSGGFTLPGATPAAAPSDTKGSSTSSKFPAFPSRSDKTDKGSDKPNPFRDGGWGKKGKN